MKNSKKSLFKTAVSAIGIMHVVNKIIDSNFITNSSSKTNGKYYHWKHGDIFYKVSGSGEPLLLVHDLTVFSSSYEWSKMAESLSDSYTVYSVDLIGCGKSDKPAITYTNYLYVQMITDFVHNVIGKKTKVAATGLSESFILQSDALDQDLFDEIMLVSPKSISYLQRTPDNRSKILRQLFDLPVIGKTAFYIATNKVNTEYYLTEKCFYNPFNLNSLITKAYYDGAHASNGNGKYLMASLEGNFINSDISKALKNTEKRILIVNGIHNENADSVNKSYASLNPNLIFETISGAKYLPQLETEEEMLELLYHF